VRVSRHALEPGVGEEVREGQGPGAAAASAAPAVVGARGPPRRAAGHDEPPVVD